MKQVITAIALAAVLIVCVTVAAIHFNNAALLWWYILAIFLV